MKEWLSIPTKGSAEKTDDSENNSNMIIKGNSRGLGNRKTGYGAAVGDNSAGAAFRINSAMPVPRMRSLTKKLKGTMSRGEKS